MTDAIGGLLFEPRDEMGLQLDTGQIVEIIERCLEIARKREGAHRSARLAGVDSVMHDICSLNEAHQGPRFWRSWGKLMPGYDRKRERLNLVASK